MAIPKPQPFLRMTVEEYLAFEETSEVKHEYHDGLVVEVLDNLGASAEHAGVTMNLGAALHAALKGGPCRVYSADLKIWVHRRRRYLYPDLSVICGKPTAPPEATKHAADNPKVLVEVLSPSSASFDRGGTFRMYKYVDSLEEYVIVEQNEPAIDVFRRQPDGTWVTTEYSGLDAELELRSLGVRVKLTDVYAGVEFPPLEERDRPA
jgi:Uma2 family endonuclease